MPNSAIIFSGVRTRFAPSPTGFMHVGNLRTALYEYLLAKSMGGSFVLRIEDTDRERLVEGATDTIFQTLKCAGLIHDEGPDIGGPCGPYVQSERMHLYRPYAEQLVREGKAYYCFCTKERLDQLRLSSDNPDSAGYDRHCRTLSDDLVAEQLALNMPHVIRQKVPLEGVTTFFDHVYGEISVPNKDLEDQVLIKADGFPTYNFANIVDDHLMGITHVVRGSEYLSSTPKYNLLYQAFGWNIPEYVHLPLIQGKNPDGTVSKLSKRHGATGFEDLVAEGYLPEAIINYIALLGWCPKDNTQEVFSLEELVRAFSIDGISKSPATFDYDKLDWFNSEYIRAMDARAFYEHAAPYYRQLGVDEALSATLLEVLQPRITKFIEIPEKISYVKALPEYDLSLFEHKKSKSTIETSISMLGKLTDLLSDISEWNKDSLMSRLTALAESEGVKNALVMWPLRIAVTGTLVTPGGAVEALLLIGQKESLNRIEIARARLSIFNN
ncbi:MAG: glutamate--tRNA ligase [Clostridiaceae bacterium]|nr:glutamate--tRNA ligase [Clostridiaceae bacterium]